VLVSDEAGELPVMLRWAVLDRDGDRSATLAFDCDSRLQLRAVLDLLSAERPCRLVGTPAHMHLRLRAHAAVDDAFPRRVVLAVELVDPATA
jgi:hypothetical protein